MTRLYQLHVTSACLNKSKQKTVELLRPDSAQKKNHEQLWNVELLFQSHLESSQQKK